MTAQGSRRRLVVHQRSGSAAAVPATAAAVSRREARPAGATRVVRGPQRERHEPDHLVLVAVVALTAIGLLMIYSSGGVATAVRTGGDPFGAVATQLGWSVAGLVGMAVLARVDYRYLRLASVPLYLFTLGLLLLVLLPPMGPIEPVTKYGSTRWLQIGPLPTIHPAEFAKLAMVVYLAHWLAKQGSQVRSLIHGLVPFLLIAGPCIGLVAVEPDLGTTGVLAMTALTLVFVAGARLWHLALLLPMAALGVMAYVSLHAYQVRRWTTFLDPWADPLGAGFQTVQGLLSLALGGFLGRGLGQSAQPGALNLPNAHNDFIFALIGQELGLLGGLTVIALFLFLAYRGVRIALAAPDTFGALLATGVTAWLAFQGLINIGVVLNLLPITGITLPFVSDGGSSLVVSFAAVGILLSISRETVARGTWNDADPDRGRGYGRPHLPRPGRPTLPVRAGRRP
ncbi:MAG: putative lipid II flippase FtsW [Chloroflexota bacterium]|nr:putative lipid II flippase FtsW [Chloroflexota bacterium]